MHVYVALSFMPDKIRYCRRSLNNCINTFGSWRCIDPYTLIHVLWYMVTGHTIHEIHLDFPVLLLLHTYSVECKRCSLSMLHHWSPPEADLPPAKTLCTSVIKKLQKLVDTQRPNESSKGTKLSTPRKPHINYYQGAENLSRPLITLVMMDLSWKRSFINLHRQKVSK